MTDADAGAHADGSIDSALGRLAAARTREHTARTEAQIPLLVRTLEAAGIDTLLLKGPTTRQRLYAADEVRPTADIDLLVAASGFGRATRQLEQLGYARVERHGHSDTLQHPADGHDDIDLHLTLPYATTPPGRVFQVLFAHASTLRVAEVDVAVLDRPAHAVHLAIHTAVNRFASQDRSFEEWRRALGDLDGPDRATADHIARAIGVQRVWDLAIAALDESCDLDTLVEDLPLWEVEPRLSSLRRAARSGLPLRVRWRDLQRMITLQLGDDALNKWRIDRGKPPVRSGTIAATVSRAHRLVVVSAKGLARLGGIGHRPPDAEQPPSGT